MTTILILLLFSCGGIIGHLLRIPILVLYNVLFKDNKW